MGKPWHRRARAAATLPALVLALAAWDDEGPSFTPPSSFALPTGLHGIGGIGGSGPARAVPAYAASSRVAALDVGALVIDADSGWLVRTDAVGAPIAHVAIGRDAGTLAYDPVAHRAYVADRMGDRIVAVDVGEQLAIAASWKTPAEPYGVALAPDRSLLLVATIADRTAVAYGLDGRERWRAPIGPEPRGVAFSADGARAAIASLATGGVGVLDLASHRVAHHAYGVAATASADRGAAHGAFAVAYLGDHEIAAPIQLEQPTSPQAQPDRYGGSETPPIARGIAFVDDRGRAVTAETNVVEGRALAWDAARDRLYVVGMATDEVVTVARASQLDPESYASPSLGTRCGADGAAVAASGDVWVWCSFPRTLVRLAADAPGPGGTAGIAMGPELAPSNLAASAHEGLVLFHTAETQVADFAQLSCGSCHVDGRADGESWLIHGERLQTPMLAGRIAGTAPYKWDGGAKDLAASLRATIARLGGTGLSAHELAALGAYLEATPPVRAPTRDVAAVARGKSLFESADVGCAVCHDGPAYTDRERHVLAKGQHAFDTPSLLGLAASAPYFHDGSAATLAALLRDHGGVHGMATDATVVLGDQQIADLTAFLETL